MRKVKLITLTIGGGAFALLSAMPGWTAESSLVATANNTIVVKTTGTVTLSLIPSTSILAGKYTSTISLGTWSASTDVGTVAFRLNPTTMKSLPTSPNIGTATSKENSSNTIPVFINSWDSTATCSFTAGNTTTDGGWIRCNQGLTSAGGHIALNSGSNFTISPGTYPLSMDAAIWAF
ncbi:TPA: hypothetical protein ACS70L_003375 [Providencia alcalifaciens]